jgi:glyceraldehyde 3-phosphate dehydrogenase
VKVLHEKIGVVHGLMTTIHAYTNDQVLTDVYHSDLRAARSATMSQIPTKTGAAAAVGLVLPELNGKLDGFAMRVPTINVSVVDLCFVAARATSKEEIDAAVKEASEGALKGILATTPRRWCRSTSTTTRARRCTTPRSPRSPAARCARCCRGTTTSGASRNRMLDMTAALMAAK